MLTLQDLTIGEDATIRTKAERKRNLVHATYAFRKPGDGSNLMDAVSLTPYCRWSNDHCDEMIPSFGSWLSNIDQFDNELFSVTRNEALVMDPQHRLILECSLACIAFEREKYDNTGVFVGIQHSEYAAKYDAFNQKLSVFSATSGALSVAAGRLSYYFGMKGPSLSIDNACSSALVSIHFGECFIESGNSISLACSASLMISKRTSESAMTAGMLTLSGRSKTLDATADGYVRAEACGVVKLYSDIEFEKKNKDIFSIRGSCVNQDGRSSSLTAPNGPSQTHVVSEAIKSACLQISEVSILGLHGTGTALGDPIEIGALISIRGQNKSIHYLSGSKSTFGHAEPASGIVGMDQATVCLKKNITGIMSHLRNMNPHVRANMGQVSATKQIHISRQRGPLVFSMKDRNQLNHGLSAFAFQGTNSHVIFAPEDVDDQVPRVQTVIQWKRKRFWYKLDRFIWAQTRIVPSATRCKFSVNLSKGNLSFLMDHVVANNILLPAVGQLEIALCCSGSIQSDCISGITHSLITRKTNLTKVSILDVSLNLVSGKLEIFEAQLISFTAVISKVPNKRSPFNEKIGFLERIYANLVHRASQILKLNIQISWRRKIMIGIIEESGHSAAQPSSWLTSPAEFDAVNHLSVACHQPGAISNIYIPTSIQSYIHKPYLPSMESSKSGQCSLQIEEFCLVTDLIHVSPYSQTRAMEITSKPLIQNKNPQRTASGIYKAGIDHVPIDLVQKISSIIEQVLNVDVPLDMPLVEAGMDSITSVDLRDQINDAFSIRLDTTVVYDYPTVNALAVHIKQINDKDKSEKHEELAIDEESTLQYDLEYPSKSISKVENTNSVHVDGMSSKLPGISGRLALAYPADELCKPIPRQVRSHNLHFIQISDMSSNFILYL